MNKIKLTDKELDKLLKIFGKDLVEYKHIKGEIQLTNKQVDIVLKSENKEDKTMITLITLCKLLRKLDDEEEYNEIMKRLGM